MDVPVEVFGNELGEFEPVVAGEPKRDERFEEDEFDELDDGLENNESRVCVTTCSAASTSCAA